MSLPIYGLYMKKVYADSSLPYKQNEDFPKPPAGFEPCHKEDFGDESQVEETVILDEDIYE